MVKMFGDFGHMDSCVDTRQALDRENRETEDGQMDG